MQASLIWLGHVEIGLADRQVDRILHLGGQVEDLANAAGVEGPGAVGEERHESGFRVQGSVFGEQRSSIGAGEGRDKAGLKAPTIGRGELPADCPLSSDEECAVPIRPTP